MKKKPKDYDIIIDGKKMKRVRLGSLANWLLPWSPDKTKDGAEIYMLPHTPKIGFCYIIYKKNGRYYIETRGG